MGTLTELYVGPNDVGQLDRKTVQTVLKKHHLSFSFKEQAWMQWGEDSELGLVFQLEAADTKNLQTAVDELRHGLATERVSVLCPGDLDD